MTSELLTGEGASVEEEGIVCRQTPELERDSRRLPVGLYDERQEGEDYAAGLIQKHL